MNLEMDPFSLEVWNTYKHHTDVNVADTNRRVAEFAASAEDSEELRQKWSERFYDLLSGFSGTVGGRIYTNAGTGWNNATLMNCFVSPRRSYDIDSVDGIMEDLKNQTQTLKSEGGWGQNFSFLRPRGAFIHGIGVESPGAIRCMEIYDTASDVITSGSGMKSKNSKAKSKVRHGAMMGILDIWHPDIIEFITAKQQPGRLSKFNLSVNCTDEFMRRVSEIANIDYELETGLCDSYVAESKRLSREELDRWDLIFPDTTYEGYRENWDGDIHKWLAQGWPTITYDTISVSWLWNLIMESTYNRAEPGIVFLDRANHFLPFYYGERITATNPCFTGDTMVTVFDNDTGYGKKRIDEVEVGDVVLSATLHPKGTTDILSKVLTSGLTRRSVQVIRSWFRKNDEEEFYINHTPDHKFYNINSGSWETLPFSDTSIPVVFSTAFDSRFGTNDFATLIRQEELEPADVYDITVEDTHCFYANDVLVHNCGEQTLAPGGVCNLGSINLTRFISKDGSGFDLGAIKFAVRTMNRLLDNINSLSFAPLPEYIDSMRNKRRVGIGIMGWGSSLYMLKTRFGSPKAASFREDLMATIAREAYMSSIDLAIEKGAFKYCNPELHAKGVFVKSLELSSEYMHKLETTGIRNSSLLSIQPTGNTSILAGVVSGGCEPVYAPEYIRTVKVPSIPKELEGVCPKWFEGEWFETSLFKIFKEGDEEVLRGTTTDGTVYKIDHNRGLTKEVLCQDYGVRYLHARGEWDPNAEWAVSTAGLTTQDHLDDLKGFARWVDSAISKTINIPHDYPFEYFKTVYLHAYSSGYIKGVTTYRAGTMTAVLSMKDEELSQEEIIRDDFKVPSRCPAVMNVMRADGRKWYLTTIMDDKNTRPIAMFVHTNHMEKGVTTHNAVELLLELARTKGIPNKWVDETATKMELENNSTKIARAISLNLRHGVFIKNIVATLDRVDSVFVGSFLFQIKKFLSSYVKNGEVAEGEICLDCGGTSIVYSEGCKKCVSCGNSKCG